MKLEDAKLDSINLLFKGEPSGGKSLAAASFPNCYIFDFESRIRSVANYWLPKGKRDIAFDTYGRKDFQKFQDKVNLFASHCPYDTIIFDTLTSVVDLLLYHAAELRGTGKGSRILAGGLKMNTIEDYGAEDAMLRSLMAHIRDMKIKYKILVAHVIQREQKVGTQSVITRQLITAGKAAGAKVPAYFDEIYHFQQKPDMNMRPSFVALTMNTGDDFARTTLNLKKEIDFTNKSFFDIIKGELTKPYIAPENLPNIEAASDDITQTETEG